MATAAPTRRRRTVAVEKSKAATPAEMRALNADIKLQERGPVKEVALLNALAGKNLVIIGPPGTGKSLLAREFCRRIGVSGERMRHFEKTLHPQMPVDALMGSYDMEKLLKESRLERKIEGYLPGADSAFLDELSRINGPVADALLPLLNTTERLYEANGTMKRSPALFMVAAVNFLPDPADPHLGAFVARLTLIAKVDYIKSDDSFKQMMRESQARKRGETGSEPQVFVGLEAFKAAQAEVQHVDANHGDFPDALVQLRRACRRAGLGVDDRRWDELQDVARAAAWLAGREFCVREDLAALEAGLWRAEVEIPKVLEVLLPYRSTFEQDAAKFRDEAADHLATHAKLTPIVESTPPSSPIDRDVSAQLGDAGRALRQVYGRVRAALADAERQKRDAPALRELLSELEDVRVWRENNDLPAKWTA